MTVAPPSHVVGVFQDVGWARRGLDALLRDGFAADTISILAPSSEEAWALCADVLSTDVVVLEIKDLGAMIAGGPLVDTLAGNDSGLARGGLSGTIHRAGFQTHDGQIFHALLARGGVLVGVLSEPRAADALARLHSYGAGNAAIGAWAGRL